MSGTFPAIYPSSVALRSFSPTRVSTSQSLKRNTRSLGVHRWYIRMNFAGLSRDKYAQISGFMDGQRGQFDNFQLVLQGYTTPRGTWSGVPVVNGAGQAGLTINLGGFTPFEGGVVKTGDIFKFSNHAKVYRATADANADAGGLATVALNAPLMVSPIDASAITFSNVPFTVASVSDSTENSVAPGLIGSIDLELIEDV